MIHILISFILSIQLVTASNYHQAKDAPTLIDADNGIECIDNARTCVASKNVKVTKGPMTLYCDKLTAKLRKTSQGQNEIYFLHAQGNVKFYGLTGDKAFSKEATYDMDKQELTLFKIHLKQEDPLVFRGQNVMKAPRFKVFLNKNNELEKVIALGQSKLDIPTKKMVENKEDKPQIRALIYPDSFKNVKPSDNKQRTESKRKP